MNLLFHINFIILLQLQKQTLHIFYLKNIHIPKFLLFFFIFWNYLFE